MDSGLLHGYRSEYPQGGFVISSGARDEDIKEGDYVLLEVDAWDMASTYFNVLHVILVDDETGEAFELFCDEEIEPVLKEHIEEFQAGGENKQFTLSDISGEGWRFLSSDVAAFQIAQSSSPAYSLLYPKNIWMFPWRGHLIYKVHESSILAILEEW
jgi:hypothetical protein